MNDTIWICHRKRPLVKALRIRARKGAKDDKPQKVYITPHPRVASDFNVIEHASDSIPDPASRFYTAFSQEDAGEETFNLIEGRGGAKPKISDLPNLK